MTSWLSLVSPMSFLVQRTHFSLDSKVGLGRKSHSLYGIRGGSQYSALHTLGTIVFNRSAKFQGTGPIKRGILVNRRLYPRLFEFLHFDIQALGGSQGWPFYPRSLEILVLGHAFSLPHNPDQTKAHPIQTRRLPGITIKAGITLASHCVSVWWSQSFNLQPTCNYITREAQVYAAQVLNLVDCE